MNGDANEPDPEFEECVPLSAYLEMTARLLGRIQALEAAAVAVLGRREDLDALARRVDEIIVNDEASRIAADGPDEETMKTHEWARQAAEALFANARLAKRRKR